MNDENLKVLLGTNIANLRKRNGMTQAGLAEQLNFSDKAVSKWERGESLPDVPPLMRLAELFDVTVDDLLKDLEAQGQQADHCSALHRVGVVCGSVFLRGALLVRYPQQLAGLRFCCSRFCFGAAVSAFGLAGFQKQPYADQRDDVGLFDQHLPVFPGTAPR